jgi:hypothetical protein
VCFDRPTQSFARSSGTRARQSVSRRNRRAPCNPTLSRPFRAKRGEHFPKPIGQSSNPASPSTDWHKVDAVTFSLFVRSGRRFHHLPGVDSYVGEIMSDSIAVQIEFGEHTSTLKEAIGGLNARMARHKTLGHGVTGEYFATAIGPNQLCLCGNELTSAQQELMVSMFEGIRFRNAVRSA